MSGTDTYRMRRGTVKPTKHTPTMSTHFERSESMRYNPSGETCLEYLRRSRPCTSFSSTGMGTASRSMPVPSAQILPSGTPFPSSTESVLTSFTASTSLTRSRISSVSFACSGEPSSGGIKALSVCRCFKVAGDIVGFGYEDKSSLTDHVGRIGIPFSSVSTFVRSVGLDEREELSLVRRVRSKTRRHPRVVLSIVGNYRHLPSGLQTAMTPNPRAVAKAIQHFLPSKLPPTLSDSPSSLYQVLSRFPRDGVGQKVYQTRWGTKGFPDCYWEVTRTKLKLEGKHGKAWGHLVWRGTSTRFF